MTRLLTLTCLLAALTSATLAESHPEHTPSPSPYPFEDVAHLALRQLNPGVDPNAATQAQQQVSPVTVYAIASQVGATAAQVQVTYTQLFSPVPDQWAAARSGAIGYGNLQKRQVEARATVVSTVMQPVVLVMATELVTRTLRRVTEVVVVETRAVTSNRTVIEDARKAGNDTLRAGNDTMRVGNDTLRISNDTLRVSTDITSALLGGIGDTGARYAARTASG